MQYNLPLSPTEAGELICTLAARMADAVRSQIVFGDEPESVMHDIKINQYREAEKLLARLMETIKQGSER